MRANSLAAALKAEEFPLPDNCREARVLMAVDSVVVIQYDVLATADDLAKLGRALQKVGEPK